MSELIYGTEREHRDTLARAKGKVDYVWSGDIRRNRYLNENLQFGIDNGIIKTEFVGSEQESGFNITWLS
jgi:hypothetical protein